MCTTIGGGEVTTTLPPTTADEAAATQVVAPPPEPPTSTMPTASTTDLAGIVQALQGVITTIQALASQLAPGAAAVPDAPQPNVGSPLDVISPEAAAAAPDPTALLAQRFEGELAALPADDPRRTELEALRPTLEQVQAEATRTGSFDPVAIASFMLSLRTVLAPDAARRAAYEALRPRMDEVRAAATASGSLDPVALQELGVRMELAGAEPGSQQAAQLQALLDGPVAQAQADATASGSFNPMALQAIAQQLDAIMHPA
jgi:hypothetical protein